MRMRLCVIAMIAWFATSAGCSRAVQQPYATAYQAALESHRGTPHVTPAMTERFARFFSHSSHTPEAGAGEGAPPLDPADLYGEPLYFSDTLLTTEDREAALRHLRRMRESTGALEVRVLDTQIDGEDAYLVWQMIAEFEPVARPVTSNTVGVTHLRFDDDGRIILHQDFWDSAEGFYRHVPVLGFMIDTIRGRFDADSP